MWTRKSWSGWVMLAALVSLPPLVGCRSDREYGGGSGSCGGGGCGGGKSPGAAPVSAGAATGSMDHAGGSSAGTAASPPAAGLSDGQRTCPVTGAALGSMGSPVPVTLNGQTVYVCCKACVAKVQRDPDAYLRKVQADRAGTPGVPAR